MTLLANMVLNTDCSGSMPHFQGYTEEHGKQPIANKQRLDERCQRSQCNVVIM